MDSAQPDGTSRPISNRELGLAHLRRHVGVDPALQGRLQSAVERRHDALRNTAGLNEEVFDALVLLAAGSWNLGDVSDGFDKVVLLKKDMDQGRRNRLLKLGYSEPDASALSVLHTRNFM